MPRLPDLLIIGATKAGTTSLYQYLSAHPQVAMSVPKEPHFFSRDENWRKGPDWYARRFPGAPAGAVTGEASASYTHHPIASGVPERIHSLIPEVKLVYLVRHPIERVRSHYGQRRHFRYIDAPIERALDDDPLLLAATRYWTQISRYLQVFAADQLLVIPTEDLRDNREATFRTVCRFIGVDELTKGIPLQEEFNTTSGRSKMQRSFVQKLTRHPVVAKLTERMPDRAKPLVHMVTRRSVPPVDPTVPDAVASRILEELAPEIDALERFLGTDLSSWRAWTG